jgi:hypothetical protein
LVSQPCQRGLPAMAWLMEQVYVQDGRQWFEGDWQIMPDFRKLSVPATCKMFSIYDLVKFTINE